MDIPLNVEQMLKPPDILGLKRVVCVQPHPDDNEIGMGGIIAVLAAAGCEVHYLTVTNGDQGNRDLTASPEQTAATRRAEAEAAGRHLGASHFHFLGHRDGTLEAVVPLSVEMAGVFRQVQPEAVFCPDPWLRYEGHWDHIVTGRAATNAFQMSGRGRIPDGGATKPWRIPVIGYYFTEIPNTVIDVTAVFDRKFEALALHDSQMDDQTMTLFRTYFTIKGQELASGRGFALGEGLRVLSSLHTHCFMDAAKI